MSDRRRLNRGWILALFALAAMWLISCGGSSAQRAEILTAQLEEGFSATVVVQKRDNVARTISGSVTITAPGNVSVKQSFPRYDPVDGVTYVVVYDGKTVQLPISKMFRGVKFTHLGDITLKAHPSSLPSPMNPG